jgi:DNA-binding Lrp family transcriptional regulator
MKPDQIQKEISTILMRSEMSIEGQRAVMDELKKQVEVLKGICTIFGSRIQFEEKIAMIDVAAKCYHIAKNPNLYSDYQSNTDEAYYKFLKFLLVRYPDGKEERLMVVAKEHKEE